MISFMSGKTDANGHKSLQKTLLEDFTIYFNFSIGFKSFFNFILTVYLGIKR